MSRIIAGAAAGRPLTSVPGTGTRPTTDRTKEALFSWLEVRDWLDGTAVLDLFAGSGALGCEAASRGAASVLLVERDRKAVTACRANAALVNRARGADVVRVDRPSGGLQLGSDDVPDPTLRGKRDQIVLTGDVPSPANPPAGCHFHTRCWKAQDVCTKDTPELEDRPDGVGRHDARRLDPEVGVAVAVRHRLARDLKQELIALGGDEAQPVELGLEQLVGGHRGAVRDRGDVLAGRAEQLEHLVDAVDEAVGRVARRGRGLGRGDRPGVLVEGDHVGERAARVDGEPHRATQPPSTASRAPCSFGFLRTKKAAIG